MSDKQNYAIWRPEYDGHAPPKWRDGMAWGIEGVVDVRHRNYLPEWNVANRYTVPAEALNSPNDDAKLPNPWTLGNLQFALRQYPAAELAKHGITLAEPKDWATELWADLFAVRGIPSAAKSTREGRLDDEDRAAIALIRERVVLKGEG